MFGALRPFKNAIGQTCALAMAAAASGRPLVLHVNGTRVEMGSANELAQIRELCQRAGLRLEVHGWLDHAAFVTLAARMHVALQVSFTETFNYVAADCVAAGTPVVGSPAIRFLPATWQVNPDDAEAIATAILDAPNWDVAIGQRALDDWNRWASAKLLQELTPEAVAAKPLRGGKDKAANKIRGYKGWIEAATKRKRTSTTRTSTRRGTVTTSTEPVTMNLAADLGIGASLYG
jgi:hypothetical protein